MSINYFDFKEVIANNLKSFLQLKGYSKLSFSKLTTISRPTIDNLLKGESTSVKQYNTHIEKINETFKLAADHLIKPQDIPLRRTRHSYAYSDHGSDHVKSPLAKELLVGLDNILDIYSIYLRK